MSFNAAEMAEIERSRLWALVEPDLELAQRLHAGEYELITPTGTRLSKELYLGMIASGRLVYRMFEPVSGIDGRWQAVWSQATKTSSV